MKRLIEAATATLAVATAVAAVDEFGPSGRPAHPSTARVGGGEGWGE